MTVLWMMILLKSSNGISLNSFNKSKVALVCSKKIVTNEGGNVTKWGEVGRITKEGLQNSRFATPLYFYNL